MILHSADLRRNQRNFAHRVVVALWPCSAVSEVGDLVAIVLDFGSDEPSRESAQTRH